MTPAEVIDSLRALTEVEVSDRTDFRLTLRSVLSTSPEELTLFDQIFDLYWGPRNLDEDEENGSGEDSGVSLDNRPTDLTMGDDDQNADDAEKKAKMAVYSPLEVLGLKDFSAFQEEEMEALARAVLILARKLSTRQSRRMRASRKSPRIDLRRTVRRNMKYGGTILELARRRRKIRKPKLVLICDVSRSMDQYSRFMLQFIYAFQHVLGKVESFVFSTQLTHVTEYFRGADIYEALDQIAHDVLDWSGGTRIGQSLKTFNEQFAANVLDSRTIVLVLSDGLDTGDVDLLDEQMALLRRRAKRILWLNPLLGSPEYRPLARGMSTALAYVDVFAAANNLKSLEELSKSLML